MSRKTRKSKHGVKLRWHEVKTFLLFMLSLLWRIICLVKYLNPIRYATFRRKAVALQNPSILYTCPTVWERFLNLFRSDAVRKRKLVEWAQEQIPMFRVTDLTTSWSDGVALCALMDAVHPGCCPRHDLLNSSNKINNCRLGLKLVYKHLQIPEVSLTPEDMASGLLDNEKNIRTLLTYIRWVSEDKGRILEAIRYSRTRSTQVACAAKGTGLAMGLVGKRCKFNVFTSSTDNIEIEIEIRGRNGEICRERIGNSSLGQRSPEECNPASKNVRNTLKAVGTKDPVSTNSRAVLHQTNIMTQTILKKKRIPLDHQIIGEGHFLISYVPRSTGIHMVSIKFNGEAISGSPYNVNIADNVDSLKFQTSNSFGDGYQKKAASYAKCHEKQLIPINFAHEDNAAAVHSKEYSEPPPVQAAILGHTSTVHRTLSSSSNAIRATVKFAKQATITRRRILRRIVAQDGQEIVIHEATSTQKYNQNEDDAQTIGHGNKSAFNQEITDRHQSPRRQNQQNSLERSPSTFEQLESSKQESLSVSAFSPPTAPSSVGETAPLERTPSLPLSVEDSLLSVKEYDDERQKKNLLFNDGQSTLYSPEAPAKVSNRGLMMPTAQGPRRRRSHLYPDMPDSDSTQDSTSPDDSDAISPADIERGSSFSPISSFQSQVSLSLREGSQPQHVSNGSQASSEASQDLQAFMPPNTFNVVSASNGRGSESVALKVIRSNTHRKSHYTRQQALESIGSLKAETSILQNDNNLNYHDPNKKGSTLTRSFSAGTLLQSNNGNDLRLSESDTRSVKPTLSQIARQYERLSTSMPTLSKNWTAVELYSDEEGKDETLQSEISQERLHQSPSAKSVINEELRNKNISSGGKDENELDMKTQIHLEEQQPTPLGTCGSNFHNIHIEMSKKEKYGILPENKTRTTESFWNNLSANGKENQEPNSMHPQIMKTKNHNPKDTLQRNPHVNSSSNYPDVVSASTPGRTKMSGVKMRKVKEDRSTQVTNSEIKLETGWTIPARYVRHIKIYRRKPDTVPLLSPTGSSAEYTTEGGSLQSEKEDSCVSNKPTENSMKLSTGFDVPRLMIKSARVSEGKCLIPVRRRGRAIVTRQKRWIGFLDPRLLQTFLATCQQKHLTSTSTTTESEIKGIQFFNVLLRREKTYESAYWFSYYRMKSLKYSQSKAICMGRVRTYVFDEHLQRARRHMLKSARRSRLLRRLSNQPPRLLQSLLTLLKKKTGTNQCPQNYSIERPENFGLSLLSGVPRDQSGRLGSPNPNTNQCPQNYSIERPENFGLSLLSGVPHDQSNRFNVVSKLSSAAGPTESASMTDCGQIVLGHGGAANLGALTNLHTMSPYSGTCIDKSDDDVPSVDLSEIIAMILSGHDESQLASLVNDTDEEKLPGELPSDMVEVNSRHSNVNYYDAMAINDLNTRSTMGVPDASLCYAFGPALHYGLVDVKNNFQVGTEGAGNGTLTVGIQGPRPHAVSETNVTYTGDNLYEVIYEVTQPGYYTITVKWSDVSIYNSPFVCKVTY